MPAQLEVREFEVRQFEEADRKAKILADEGGKRPKQGIVIVAVLTAVGVFMLLALFAAVTLSDRNEAFWPVVILTIVCGGGAGVVQWWREESWRLRYHKALAEFLAVRKR
jgi:hypothetical protein